MDTLHLLYFTFSSTFSSSYNPLIYDTYTVLHEKSYKEKLTGWTEWGERSGCGHEPQANGLLPFTETSDGIWQTLVFVIHYVNPWT